MANTPNYNLKKVEYTEIADIPAHFNGNMDVIDSALKSQADELATKETPGGAQAKADTAEDNAKSFASGLIGTLSNLLTTAKNNIVAAVNEIFGKVEDVEVDLAAHKAESASKHIKESGNNANGSYIKFDDGTMICYMRVIRTTGNGSSYKNLSVPLPASFVNNSYTVIVTPTGRYRMSDGQGSTTKYFNAIPVTLHPDTIYTLRFLYGDGSVLETDYVFEVNLVAIGRWK